eukprot:scaffold25842_cov198-Amphora_coffeaeformis.AAC.21
MLSAVSTGTAIMMRTTASRTGPTIRRGFVPPRRRRRRSIRRTTTTTTTTTTTLSRPHQPYILWTTGAAAILVLSTTDVTGGSSGSISSSSSSSYRNHNNSIRKTYNHCQVPCGIFDDPAVVREIHQAILTIRKAMAQINLLVVNNSSNNNNDPLAWNQAVRWITVKEQHSQTIIDLIANYCLCQRVKRSLFETEQEYLHALKLHHVVMQAAMKTKQSVHEADCDTLMKAAQQMAKMYTK